MQTWFFEDQTAHMRIGLRVKQVLFHQRSAYQEVQVLDTYECGRVLVLDDVIQVTELDEFCYHEMMAHVPAFAHPGPRTALVVGGGDGGSIRELLKHPTVERADLCEIDEVVLRAAREHLPTVASGLDDPRCRVLVQDAVAWIQNAAPGSYDVIVVDAPDPTGPAVALFDADFQRACARALHPDGFLVVQSENPFFFRDVLGRAQRSAREAFPRVWCYWGVVPTYPGGLWTYTLASHGPDPLAQSPELLARRAAKVSTRYWTPEVHRACFVLPPYLRQAVEP